MDSVAMFRSSRKYKASMVNILLLHHVHCILAASPFDPREGETVAAPSNHSKEDAYQPESGEVEPAISNSPPPSPPPSLFWIINSSPPPPPDYTFDFMGTFYLAEQDATCQETCVSQNLDCDQDANRAIYTEDIDVLNVYLNAALANSDVDPGFSKGCKKLRKKKNNSGAAHPVVKPHPKGGNKAPICEISESPTDFTCWKAKKKRHALCLCTALDDHNIQIGNRVVSKTMLWIAFSFAIGVALMAVLVGLLLVARRGEISPSSTKPIHPSTTTDAKPASNDSQTAEAAAAPV